MRAIAKKCVIWLLQRFVSAVEWHHCECCTTWPLDCHFHGQTFSYAFCYKKCAGSGCRLKIFLESHGPHLGVSLVGHVKKLFSILQKGCIVNGRLYSFFVSESVMDLSPSYEEALSGIYESHSDGLGNIPNVHDESFNELNELKAPEIRPTLVSSSSDNPVANDSEIWTVPMREEEDAYGRAQSLTFYQNYPQCQRVRKQRHHYQQQRQLRNNGRRREQQLDAVVVVQPMVSRPSSITARCRSTVEGSDSYESHMALARCVTWCCCWLFGKMAYELAGTEVNLWPCI